MLEVSTSLLHIAGSSGTNASALRFCSRALDNPDLHLDFTTGLQRRSFSLFGPRLFCSPRLSGNGLALHNSLDVLGNVDCRVAAAVALDGDAVLVDEELLEVPRDVRALNRGPDDELRVSHELRPLVALGDGQDGLHVRKKRQLVLAVHVGAREEGEVGLVPIPWANVFELVEDLASLVVSLMAELVRGETKAHETLRAEFLRERVHSFEVAHGRASQGRHVLDQENFALEIGHVHHASVQELCLELVDRFCGGRVAGVHVDVSRVRARPGCERHRGRVTKQRRRRRQARRGRSSASRSSESSPKHRGGAVGDRGERQRKQERRRARAQIHRGGVGWRGVGFPGLWR
mmetsp:Transcript_9451/g.23285  ORF Transcript_9451/g.23285 Transcript_9451/m.23285 type:complete len:347 (+) Transcript_9451:248-1288(+)